MSWLPLTFISCGGVKRGEKGGGKGDEEEGGKEKRGGREKEDRYN